MTEYKENVWYGWNGGECPVHPDSIVEVRNLKSGEIDNVYSWIGSITESAGWFDVGCWQGIDDDKTNPIVAFRVVEAFREPREFWISKHDGQMATSKRPYYAPEAWIRVREVMDGAE